MYLFFNKQIFKLCIPHFLSGELTVKSLVSITYADNTQHLEIVKKGDFTAGTIVAEVVTNKEEQQKAIKSLLTSPLFKQYVLFYQMV